MQRLIVIVKTFFVVNVSFCYTVMYRRSNNDWIVGSYNEKCLSDASKLPTNRSVLSRYLFFRHEFKSESTRELFKVIVSEIEFVWNKAGIPKKGNREILDQLTRLFHRWDSLKKIPVSQRQKPNSRLESLKRELESLCDVSAIDAHHQMRSSRRKNWKEDWLFYEDQRGPRKAYMTNLDQELVRSEEQISSRRLKELIRINKARQPADKVIALESDSEYSDKENHDDEFHLKPSKKKKPTTVELHVPVQLINNSSITADRCGVSLSSQLLLRSKFVTLSGGNLSDFHLSKTSVWRQRVSARREQSESIKAEWLKSNPRHLIIHWDTKVFAIQSGKKEERIAIILSGSTTG